MKKSLAVIFLLLSIASFAGEKLVASWDFTSGSLIDTVKGITLTPRGATSSSGDEMFGERQCCDLSPPCHSVIWV